MANVAEPMFAASVGTGIPVGAELVCASCVGRSDLIAPAGRDSRSLRVISP
jgi:hypothetical protein